MTRFYVAIDGGGTKTDIALFSDDGRILKRVIGESTNPNALSDDQIKKHFTAIFSNLFSEDKPSVITRCFAGMSGADHPTLNQKLKKIIQETLPVPCEDTEIENDAINALWSGTDGMAGVVVIAGTGSIAYGRRDDGSHFRIGGWGHLVGDDGSGYYIGKEAVRDGLRAHDGVEPPAPLYEKIMSHFDIKDMPDIIPIVYNSHKTILSGLAPIVVESANSGDEAAIKILKNSSRFLAELIRAALSRFNTKQIPVVLTGGLWHADIIRKEVMAEFEQPFIFPNLPPVYGSMVGALKERKDNQLLEQLKKALIHNV